MGIQSSINSTLGTLRVFGALTSGKKYIDEQVQKGSKSVEKATGEVKDAVKESAKEISNTINTWVDKDGNEFFGKGPNYDPDLEAWYDSMREEEELMWENKRLADKYRSELQRAKDAQASVYAKLKSKQDARDSVNSMKDILKGNKNLNGGAN